MSFQKIAATILVKNATIDQIIVAINKIVSYLNDFIQNFIGKPQFNSVILSDIVVQVGINQIPHKLNTTLTGWQVIRQSEPAVFCDQQTLNNDTDVYLYLVSSAPATISLLVF